MSELPADKPVVLVDADACPVKPEILKVADRFSVEVYLVANSGLRPSRDAAVHHVLVSGSFDAADDWIVDKSRPGDVAVTADIPLAARLVEKGVNVLSPTGRVHSDDTIGMTLAMRNLNQDLREAGEIQSYNPSFTAKDRSAFLQALDRLLRQSLKNSKQGNPQ